MKAIMHIDKVHPIIIAVILAVLVVIFLPSGVLSELRGEIKPVEAVAEAEPRADAFLSLVFSTATEEGAIFQNNVFTWATAGLVEREVPVSLLQDASLP